MSTESRLINRELSWLEFNQRVLDEARDASVPLLDRLFFLAVTASNLDEFFMVRVGGLKLLVEGNVTSCDPSGLTPREQLRRILARVRRMVEDQYECLARELLPGAAAHGLRILKPAAMDAAQHAFVERYVEDAASSILTPLAVEAGGDRPVLVSRALHLAVMLHAKKPSKPPRFAVLRLGRERILHLPSEGNGHDVALLEDVVALGARSFFQGQTILASTCFRITRNADIPVREEYAEDLATEMEAVLRIRRSSDCVRLELAEGACSELRDFVVGLAGADADDVVDIPGPLDLTGLGELCKLETLSHLRYPPWPPQPNLMVDATKSIFDEIAARDILVSLPFERFDPVVRFVQQAAVDPDVLAIKIILYRTGDNSPIAQALATAAERGKSVTAVVELKARFDEASNIAWARTMETAGVQVVYGIKGFKTHAKACMVVRREEGVIVRYLHLATGNYNESTARFYTDVGLLTCNAALGLDIAAFFHAITGYSVPQSYQKIAQAPLNLRERLLALVQGEAQRAKSGQPARIMAKMNSLVDPTLIDALYEASQAGVDIRLNVRGICMLRPGVKGLSEHIRIVSIVDRCLEHSRIFRFHHGGDDLLFLSSADWMPRNLDRRIELLVPVEDAACRKRLVHILETCLADTAKGREMLPDGTYRRPAGGPQALRSQAVLYKRACDAAKQKARSKTTLFEPHRPARQRRTAP